MAMAGIEDQTATIICEWLADKPFVVDIVKEPSSSASSSSTHSSFHPSQLASSASTSSSFSPSPWSSNAADLINSLPQSTFSSKSTSTAAASAALLQQQQQQQQRRSSQPSAAAADAGSSGSPAGSGGVAGAVVSVPIGFAFLGLGAVSCALKAAEAARNARETKQQQEQQQNVARHQKDRLGAGSSGYSREDEDGTVSSVAIHDAHDGDNCENSDDDGDGNGADNRASQSWEADIASLPEMQLLQRRLAAMADCVEKTLAAMETVSRGASGGSDYWERDFGSIGKGKSPSALNNFFNLPPHGPSSNFFHPGFRHGSDDSDDDGNSSDSASSRGTTINSHKSSWRATQSASAAMFMKPKPALKAAENAAASNLLLVTGSSSNAGKTNVDEIGVGNDNENGSVRGWPRASRAAPSVIGFETSRKFLAKPRSGNDEAFGIAAMILGSGPLPRMAPPRAAAKAAPSLLSAAAAPPAPPPPAPPPPPSPPPAPPPTSAPVAGDPLAALAATPAAAPVLAAAADTAAAPPPPTATAAAAAASAAPPSSTKQVVPRKKFFSRRTSSAAAALAPSASPDSASPSASPSHPAAAYAGASAAAGGIAASSGSFTSGSFKNLFSKSTSISSPSRAEDLMAFPSLSSFQRSPSLETFHEGDSEDESIDGSEQDFDRSNSHPTHITGAPFSDRLPPNSSHPSFHLAASRQRTNQLPNAPFSSSHVSSAFSGHVSTSSAALLQNLSSRFGSSPGQSPLSSPHLGHSPGSSPFPGQSPLHSRTSSFGQNLNQSPAHSRNPSLGTSFSQSPGESPLHPSLSPGQSPSLSPSLSPDGPVKRLAARRKSFNTAQIGPFDGKAISRALPRFNSDKAPVRSQGSGDLSSVLETDGEETALSSSHRQDPWGAKVVRENAVGSTLGGQNTSKISAASNVWRGNSGPQEGPTGEVKEKKKAVPRKKLGVSLSSRGIKGQADDAAAAGAAAAVSFSSPIATAAPPSNVFSSTPAATPPAAAGGAASVLSSSGLLKSGQHLSSAPSGPRAVPKKVVHAASDRAAARTQMLEALGMAAPTLEESPPKAETPAPQNDKERLRKGVQDLLQKYSHFVSSAVSSMASDADDGGHNLSNLLLDLNVQAMAVRDEIDNALDRVPVGERLRMPLQVARIAVQRARFDGQYLVAVVNEKERRRGRGRGESGVEKTGDEGGVGWEGLEVLGLGQRGGECGGGAGAGWCEEGNSEGKSEGKSEGRREGNERTEGEKAEAELLLSTCGMLEELMEEVQDVWYGSGADLFNLAVEQCDVLARYALIGRALAECIARGPSADVAVRQLSEADGALPASISNSSSISRSSSSALQPSPPAHAASGHESVVYNDGMNPLRGIFNPAKVLAHSGRGSHAWGWLSSSSSPGTRAGGGGAGAGGSIAIATIADVIWFLRWKELPESTALDGVPSSVSVRSLLADIGAPDGAAAGFRPEDKEAMQSIVLPEFRIQAQAHIAAEFGWAVALGADLKIQRENQSSPRTTTNAAAAFQSRPSKRRGGSIVDQLGVRLAERSARAFSLEEILTATGGWDERGLIGEGGFGNVYRGVLESGQVVAVKRAKQASQGTYETFLREIQVLAPMNHRHLVSLVGHCQEENEQILVYEFVPNGTLGQWLRSNKKSGLTLKQRLTIAIGAAEGLKYLHMFAKSPIIHRDIKSENILLDGDMQAKVSDFGMFKSTRQDGSSISSSKKGNMPASSVQLVGTPGYCDPEYASTFRATRKSDVYSFGVVLLELVTGLPAIFDSAPNGHHGPKAAIKGAVSHFSNLMRKGGGQKAEDGAGKGGSFAHMQKLTLVNWAKPFISAGRAAAIMDPSMGGKVQFQAVQAMASVAAMCVRSKASERPDMAEVVARLEAIRLQGGEGKKVINL